MPYREVRREPRKSLSTRLKRFESAVRRRLREDLRVLKLHLRNRRRFRAVANPYGLIWIRPEDVTEKIRPGAPPVDVSGDILDGDWDRNTVPFRDSPKHLSLVDHFTRGTPWRETILFREVYPRRLARDGRIMGKCSLKDMEAHYSRHVDALFQDIRDHGFRAPSVWRWVDAVYARIGRGGEFLWGFGGNHRLSIAKILSVSAVPVRVELRHLKWQMCRETVKRKGGTGHAVAGGHPDLVNLGQRKAGMRSWLFPVRD